MKKNTVILDVEKYNELRDFKKAIEDGFIIKTYDGFSYMKMNMTESEALVEMSKRIDELNKINNDLWSKIATLNLEIKELKNPVKKELTVDDIKKMSYWEFKKWKNKQ
jgi:hypothetical protein